MKIKVRDVNHFKRMLVVNGYSGKSLSNIAELSHNYTVQIINGKRYPSPRVAKKLLEVLDVQFDDIFFIEDDTKKEH